uniref:Uncharacterized protein n=1 Tax=Cucumis melo TaxID=3656 RepID=A0A9I9E6G2_CUCME
MVLVLILVESVFYCIFHNFECNLNNSNVLIYFSISSSANKRSYEAQFVDLEVKQRSYVLTILIAQNNIVHSHYCCKDLWNSKQELEAIYVVNDGGVNYGTVYDSIR